MTKPRQSTPEDLERAKRIADAAKTSGGDPATARRPGIHGTTRDPDKGEPEQDT